MTSPEIPKKLGRYEIVRELGKGAMGVVYEGRDPNIGRRVAIKTARADVMEGSPVADEMMTRFLREAQAAGVLNHPNIITIYDADIEDDIAYIAMEFVEGGNLKDLMASPLRHDAARSVEIAAVLCEALACAHEHGIVHRDMKPANIMMPDGGAPKIADFGIAHVSDSTLTQEGAMIGTPHYMSPEQFMGQKIDGRSDLFSVGVILYEMITCERPFGGEALSTVMHHVIKTHPSPPDELNYNVSPVLGQVVMKAIAKRPAERYPDGRAMAAALRESLKDHPDPAVLHLAPANLEATAVSHPEASATVITNGPGATVATPSPPDFEGIPAVAPAQGARRAGLSERSLILAAIPILLVSAVLLAWFLRGDGHTSPPGNEVSPPPTNETALLPEVYFSSFLGDFYKTDEATYREWEQGAELDDLTGRLAPATVDIDFYKAGETAPFQSVQGYVSGDLIQFKEPCRTLRYVVRFEGRDVYEQKSISATLPQQREETRKPLKP